MRRQRERADARERRQAIRLLLRLGLTRGEVAEKLKVSRWTVWRHSRSPGRLHPEESRP